MPFILGGALEEVFFLFNNVKILFIFGCAGSLLLHRSFSLVEAREGCSLLEVRFSLRRLLLLQATGSRRAGFTSRRVRLNSWSLWFPCCIWDLPRPGIKPMSPALAGGFLTTGPPGKSD